ncbi:unnamed protein product [Sphagnum jensenii]|uniref:Uncharacterized protein n=1 Tax=Sphagnum jensenii TaxID=128206 RepID=A0ABP0W5U5_9BRYO
MHLDRPAGTSYAGIPERAGFSAESSGEGSAAVPIGCIWTVHLEPYRKSPASPREALAKARLVSTRDPVPSSSSSSSFPPPRLLPSLVQLPKDSQGEIYVKLGRFSLWADVNELPYTIMVKTAP